MLRCSSERSARRMCGAAVGIVVLLIASCADQPLAVSEWHDRWQQVVDHVDDTLITELTQNECEETLGYIREERTGLTPPPLADLEAPVRAWFDQAEDIFFVCEVELGTGGTPATLQALEAEIEAVITVET